MQRARKILKTNNLHKKNQKVVSSVLEHTTEHGALEKKTQTQLVKFYNLDTILNLLTLLVAEIGRA